MLDVIQPAQPCVGSGLCCQKGPCGFGERTSPTDPVCKHLEVRATHGDVTVYQCGKHDEIVRDPTSVLSPAFGEGCCMPLFNAARRRIIQLINSGEMERPYERPS